MTRSISSELLSELLPVTNRCLWSRHVPLFPLCLSVIDGPMFARVTNRISETLSEQKDCLTSPLYWQKLKGEKLGQNELHQFFCGLTPLYDIQRPHIRTTVQDTVVLHYRKWWKLRKNVSLLCFAEYIYLDSISDFSRSWCFSKLDYWFSTVFGYKTFEALD